MTQVSNNNKIFTPEEICKFWFGEVKDDKTEIPWDKKKLWYMGGKEFDQLIENNYGTLMVDLLDKHKYDNWLKTPIGHVATIIIGDQFTRNVYRDTQKAFAYDKAMQDIVCNGIKNGMDKKILELHPNYLSLYYHPLMHSETKELQELSKKQYEWLFKTLEESNHPLKKVSDMRKYVDGHKLIIDTFNRYIFRDKIRNIKLTKEEYQKLLKLPQKSLEDYKKTGAPLPED